MRPAPILELMAPDDGGAELLAAPVRSRSYRVAVLSFVLVLAVFGAWRLHNGGSSKPHALSTVHRTTAPPNPLAQQFHPSPRLVGNLALSVAGHPNPKRCPPTIECEARSSLPLEFLHVVAQAVPGLTVTSAERVTQTNPLRVYYRELAASDGQRTLTVVVIRNNLLAWLKNSQSIARSGADRIEFVRRSVGSTLGGYAISVELREPLTDPAEALANLSSLALDHRLLAVF